MKVNYVQKGESINYVNTGNETINAGTIVVLGKRVGAAGCDIPPQKLGSVHVVGVFSVAKDAASTVLAVGDEVFYTESGAVLNGEIRIGWVVEPSPAGVADVLVKID